MSIPPPEVIDVQRAASDPAASAWVAANAGSGKTHVLAQRVIRLLLRGTAPEKILCLTYTKAAAANMANRVFETLARWTPLSDDELDAEIARIEGGKPSAMRRLRARRLFAQALDTPGGLKVQTIHAFCTRLLASVSVRGGCGGALRGAGGAHAVRADRPAAHGGADAGGRAARRRSRPRARRRDHGRGGHDVQRDDRRGDIAA